MFSWNNSSTFFLYAKQARREHSREKGCSVSLILSANPLTAARSRTSSLSTFSTIVQPLYKPRDLPNDAPTRAPYFIQFQ